MKGDRAAALPTAQPAAAVANPASFLWKIPGCSASTTDGCIFSHGWVPKTRKYLFLSRRWMPQAYAHKATGRRRPINACMSFSRLDFGPLQRSEVCRAEATGRLFPAEKKSLRIDWYFSSFYAPNFQHPPAGLRGNPWRENASEAGAERECAGRKLTHRISTPPGSDRAAELTSSNAQLEEQLAGSRDPSSRKRFLRRSIKRPDGERFLLCRLSPELRMTSAFYRWSPPTAWPPHAPPAVHRKVTNQERRLLPSSIGAKLRGSCSTRAQPVSFPPPVTHADHDVSWPGGRVSQLVQGVERVRADGGSAVSAEEGEPDAGPLPAALSRALPGRVHWAAGAGGRGQQSR